MTLMTDDDDTPKLSSVIVGLSMSSFQAMTLAITLAMITNHDHQTFDI